MSRIPGESINTSYPRRAAWTLRATQAVMRRFDDVRLSGGPEFYRLQDVIEWLDARDDRIMAECLADEAIEDDHDFRCDSRRDDGPWMPREEC